ncbi:MAG: hypothetical protein AAGI37_15680 [Planctomycetota bacterium]
MATELALQRSEQIFSPTEKDHPMRMVFEVQQHQEAEQQRRQQVHDDFLRQAQAQQRRLEQQRRAELARVHAINEQNRRRWENPKGFQQQPQH